MGLKANIPQENLEPKDAPEEDSSQKVNKSMEVKQKLVPPKKSMSPIPSNAAPPKMSPVHEKDTITPKAVCNNGTDKYPRQKKRKKKQKLSLSQKRKEEEAREPVPHPL